MTKEKLDITELGEITYNIEQARNLLLVLSDNLDRAQPKTDTVKEATQSEVFLLAYEIYRDYDKWIVLIDIATEKLNDQIKRLENAQ
ncbi:hypothetical protein [Lapidilactobacillus bayanensis]|uniref:hypothetical protein n=1 Tax=Lapidilactobacillus bayanensis TaxID=2485998 RepID=UPI000F7793B4|nr:hypothetical protein [Lapidilactobacillus bayanensis]